MPQTPQPSAPASTSSIPTSTWQGCPLRSSPSCRKAAPIHWVDEPGGAGGFDDGGFWVVTKHKDVKEVSRRSDVFSSLENTALPRYKDGTVREQVDRGKFVLLNMDAPHHTHLRKIISRGFTPRAVDRLRDDLHERAQNIAEGGGAEGPATSSSRCRASCRCRPSPA